MRALTCLLPGQWLVFTVGLWAACGLATPLTAQVINADETGANGGGVAEASYTSSGSYFSRELGTPLRFGYHSEGYGTDTGVVSLGTMKVFNLDGATWFLDGQGTMSDDFGGGFNAGIGYRELVNRGRGFDPERILGASFWTDGQNTRADNFFTQLGFGLESLGESFDLRMNGYFPLERTKSSDPTLIDFDTVTFSENRLFAGIERVRTDTAHSVVDAEAAKRLGNLDAWAIAGIYQLGGGGADDTGYRLGVRGYALPDLLVGVQVTDDDLYHTNVMATLTWFVGRTHKGNAPVGTIVDRFREPVFRNDFISTTTAETTQGAGGPLTDADNDELFNFIHVDSTAAAGGTGTFENPFNNLADAEAAQVEDAYIYVHGGSVLATVAADPFTLLDNVKFWGEGTNQDGDVVVHVVDSVERGSLNLPETAPGAQDLDSPTINVAAGTNFIELADNNDVNNFEINGGVNAVTGNAINAPQLANLDINNPTGIGVSLTEITGTTVIDNTVTIDGAATGMRIDGGSEGMNINAQITNSIGSSLIVENREGGTIAYGGSIQDDNAVVATDDAIVIQNNNDAIINFTQAINTGVTPVLGIDIDSGNFNSLQITGNDDGTAINFSQNLAATAANADTIFFTERGSLTIQDTGDNSLISNTGTGDAFHYEDGTATDADAIITVASDINNSGGGEAVEILDHDENNITFSGDIQDSNSNGIVLTNNANGTIAFSGLVDVNNSGAGNGVIATSNADNITYRFANIDIDIDSGIGFSITGDGTLIVTSAEGTNRVETNSGQALVLDGLAQGLTIGTGGAIFDEVNVLNGTTNSIVLRDLQGTDQVRIGAASAASADPGDGGTISTTMTAITIDNANNVAVNDVIINKSGAGQGVLITDQDGGTLAFNEVNINATGAANGLVVGTAAAGEENTDGTASFTDLTVTHDNGTGVSVIENEGGTYVFNNLETDTNVGGTGAGVVIDNNSTDTTVTFNGMDLTTGSGTGFAASDGGTVAASGTNNVTTASGTAVNLDTIASGGISFTSVTKTGGAGSGVIVNTVTGGPVTIGSAGTASTINTTGDGIVVTDSTNVTVNNVNLTGAGGNGLVADHTNDVGYLLTVNNLTVAATKTLGIVSTHTGGGTFVLNINDSDNVADINAASTFAHTGGGTYTVDINNTDFRETVAFNADGSGTVDITADDSSFITSAVGDVAFSLVLDPTVTLANIRVRRNTITAVDAIAFNFDGNSTNSKTVNFLFDDNTVSNNSATANAADFNANDATILNATVTDSNFSNAAGPNADPLLANDFFMASNDGTTVVNLNLNNNIASGGPGIIYLRELAGDFNIQDLPDVQARNPQSMITFDPNMAAFDDIDSVPTPP